MDSSQLIAALIGGAIAASKGIATQAVEDAYQGLKRILVDAYGLLSPGALEKFPDSDAPQALANDEIAGNSEIMKDEAVLKEAGRLEEALLSLPTSTLSSLGISIDTLVAGGRIVASGESITGRYWRSEGDIILTASGDHPKKK